MSHMELSLKIDREEMFDPYVLTPHNELNSVIYSAVDRWLKKTSPDELTLYIYSHNMHEVLQERVREIFREHYTDERGAMKRKLRYVYIRLLILTSVAMTLLSYQLNLSGQYGNNVIILVMGQFGAYFLWQIGDTLFDWLEKYRTMKQIKTALKADIVFIEYNKGGSRRRKTENA